MACLSVGRVIVDSAVYRNGSRVLVDCRPGDLHDLRSNATEKGDFVWVGLHDPTEAELEDVAIAFGLHPLAVEDALNAHQRPKLERYEESLFLVLRTLWYVDETDQVETGEINIFVGEDFVVTVRHGQGGGLKDARRWLEGREQVLSHGPVAVVYAVCDQVVDHYEAVVGGARGRRRRGRGLGLLRRAHPRLGPDLRAQARARGDAPGGAAAPGAAEPVRRRHRERSPPGRGAVLPRRRRPPRPRLRDHRHPRLAAVDRVRGAHGADQHPAERRHAPDLRHRRPDRRADPGRFDLRHELRAHARALLGRSATRWRCS